MMNLSSFADQYGEHVCFVTADQHVHQLYYNGASRFDGVSWADQDLTAMANGSAAVGSALSSFADQYGEHVCFVTADQHVHQLYYNGANWADQDLTAIAIREYIDLPLAGRGTGLSSFADRHGEHVCFLKSIEGGIHQLLFDGANWADWDLTYASEHG